MRQFRTRTRTMEVVEYEFSYVEDLVNWKARNSTSNMLAAYHFTNVIFLSYIDPSPSV